MLEEKIESIDLTDIILPPGLVSQVPPQLISKYQFIPVALKDNVLTVVFGQRPDEKTINEIKAAVKHEVKVVLSSQPDVRRHIQRLIPEFTGSPSKSIFLRSVSDSLQITRSQILKYTYLVKDLMSTRKKLNYVIIGGITFTAVFCVSLLVLFIWRGRAKPPQENRVVFLGKHAVLKTMENFARQKNPSENAKVIYARNNKAVVLIRTYQENGSPLAQGSGFIVRSDGAVVTNFHVIREAHSIEIILNPDRAEQTPLHFDVAGIIFTDRENDLAVLKADARDLPYVQLGDSDKLTPGDNAFVISSPLRDFLSGDDQIDTMNTITQGIVSNTKKNKIQISAQISPGSSGGPVFNAKGEVIGVATMLIKAEFQAQNINFAMPINLIKDKISKTTFTPVDEFDLR